MQDLNCECTTSIRLKQFLQQLADQQISQYPASYFIFFFKEYLKSNKLNNDGHDNDKSIELFIAQTNNFSCNS